MLMVMMATTSEMMIKNRSDRPLAQTFSLHKAYRSHSKLWSAYDQNGFFQGPPIPSWPYSYSSYSYSWPYFSCFLIFIEHSLCDLVLIRVAKTNEGRLVSGFGGKNRPCNLSNGETDMNRSFNTGNALLEVGQGTTIVRALNTA